MASITLPIRALVIKNPTATVDQLLEMLKAQGLEPKRDTVSTIRSDTTATLQLMAELTVSATLAGEQPPVPTAKVKKAKKVRAPGRNARWSDAAARAVAALEELKDIQSEYADWKDNLPENLQNSPVGEKLNTVCDLDLDSAIDTASEAEGADLPLGFGRD